MNDQLYNKLNQKVNRINDKVETPEYSTTQTSTASITSLPATVSGGELAVEVSGRTVTNLAGAGTTSPQTVSGLNASTTYLLRNTLGANVTVNTVSTPTPAKITGEISYNLVWASGNIALYPLTTAEALLTSSELAQTYDYISGTKSTDKMRTLTSNTIVRNGNAEKDTAHWKAVGGASIVVSNDFGEKGFFVSGSNVERGVEQKIKLPSNSTVPISVFLTRSTTAFGTAPYKAEVYDSNNNSIGGVSSANILGEYQLITGTITTNDDTNYTVRLFYEASVAGGVFREFYFRKLVIGSTTYEPYSPTQAVNPKPLRNLPNGVSDTFNANTGVHRQNVSAMLPISGTQYDALTTTGTNVDTVTTTAFTPALAGTTALDGRTRVFNSAGAELEEVAFADIDLVASVGKYYYGVDKLVRFIVAKGAYPTIADARTGLDTSTIKYQLASPVTEYFFPSVINAKASGSIIQEPYFEDVGKYTTNIAIIDTTKPIVNLTHVNKVNVLTGALTPVPLSDCTVAVGGLTFTITGASSGEFYEYGANYDETLRVNGSIDYSYSVNLKGTVDGATKQIENLDRENKQLQTLLQTAISRISAIEDELAAP